MKSVIEPMPFPKGPEASAPAWPLAPLLAGARARGVADAFEWLGLAAILLDERGEVLHLSAGAVELICCVLAIRDQVLPPTMNLDNADPECDLDYVPNHTRAFDGEYALSNSFAFGGLNAVLVLRRL